MAIRDPGVVLVHDGYSAREHWSFECLRCWHVWEEDYVARRLTDDHGNEVHVWLRSGVTVQPPWSDASCPGCGAYRVTSFPPGYLARHPELAPAPRHRPAAPDPVAASGLAAASDPAADPAVAGPAAVPDPAAVKGARRAARAPRHGRLLVTIGVPVLAFVGYEVWAVYVSVAHAH